MINVHEKFQAAPFALPVLRIGANRSGEVVVQSHQPMTVNTHWLGRRLWCLGPNCPACSAVPSRLITYAVVVCKFQTGEHAMLLEATMAKFSEWVDRVGIKPDADFAGIRLTASRGPGQSPIKFVAIMATAVDSEPAEIARGSIIPIYAGFFPMLSAATRLAGLPAPLTTEEAGDYVLRVYDAIETMLLINLDKRVDK